MAGERTKESRRRRRVPYGVHAAYGTGAALILLGAAGMVAESSDTAPVGWALWVGGAVLAHDLVLAPLALLAGVLLGRLPSGLREPMRVAAIITGCLTIMALPMVLGLGMRAGDTSRLPLPYGANLLSVVTAVAAATLVYALVRNRRGSHGRATPWIAGAGLAISLITSVVGLAVEVPGFVHLAGVVALVVSAVTMTFTVARR